MQELMTALITPFDAYGEIDYKALALLVDEQLEDGCDGFIVCGTTAETPTLNMEERMKILDLVIEKVKGRAQIWYGCGTNYTAGSIRAVQQVENKAITGVLLVTPYYNRPSQSGIYEHFKTIAQHTIADIMLYNIPSRCGSELHEETLDALLCECPNIKALKHAAKNLDLCTHILASHPEFRIYSGEDGFFNEGFDAGMSGLVSVMSHVAMKTLRSYVDGERVDEVLKAKLAECAAMTFIESSPSPVKYMMACAGRCENTLRLPLVPLSQKNREILDAWMAENDNLLQL